MLVDIACDTYLNYWLFNNSLSRVEVLRERIN